MFWSSGVFFHIVFSSGSHCPVDLGLFPLLQIHKAEALFCIRSIFIALKDGGLLWRHLFVTGFMPMCLSMVIGFSDASTEATDNIVFAQGGGKFATLIQTNGRCLSQINMECMLVCPNASHTWMNFRSCLLRHVIFRISIDYFLVIKNIGKFNYIPLTFVTLFSSLNTPTIFEWKKKKSIFSLGAKPRVVWHAKFIWLGDFVPWRNSLDASAIPENEHTCNNRFCFLVENHYQLLRWERTRHRCDGRIWKKKLFHWDLHYLL